MTRTTDHQPGIVTHAGCLIASAVLLALSFPLPGWAFLAWVALVPAGYVAVRSARPWTLAGLSFAVFGVWWCWMLRWLWPVTGPGVIALSLYMALQWVLALVGTRYVVRRTVLPVAVVLPVMWVGLEWLRCQWPVGGFAWFTLGQTQAPWEQFETNGIGVQLASWFGVSAVGLVIASCAGLLVDFATTRYKRRWAICVMVVMFAGVCLHEHRVLTGHLVDWQTRFARGSQLVLPDDLIESHPVVSLIQTNSPHSNKASPTVETLERDWVELKRLHERAVAILTSLPLGGVPADFGGRGGGSAVDSTSASDASAVPPPRPLNSPPEGRGVQQQMPALIVLPETVIPGKFNEQGAAMYQRYALSLDPTREQGAFWRVLADMVPRAKRLIAEGGVPTVVGGSTLEYDAFNQEREYNSAFLVNGDGTSGGRYDKMHRVPWGEYIPGPAWLKDAVLRYLSPYGPENDYTIDAGERVVVMEVDWPVVRLEYVQVSPPPAFPNSLSATHHDVLRFATPICFEDTVGRLCRRMVFDPQTGEKRIDALVNLTTNGWFGYLPESGDPSSGGLAWESMRLQHLQIATLRAIENRVTVARAVNTGCSAIIAPSGMILAMGAPGWAEVVTGPIVRDERVPLYAIVGEWPMVGVFSLGVVMLVCPWLLPFGQKRVRLPGGKPSSGVDVSKPASAD